MDWVPRVGGFVDLRWCDLREGTTATLHVGGLVEYRREGVGATMVATYGLVVGGLVGAWLGWVFKEVPPEGWLAS